MATISRITPQEWDIANAFSSMDRAFNTAQAEITPQDSYYIGRAAAAYILQRYRPYTERPAITQYLNLICAALAINSPAPDWYNGYHVMILDSPELNAFSTPGGHIFITRGLIGIVSSEDMLAAVIAHEMAHIQLRHGIKEIEHERFMDNLSQERNRAANIAEQEATGKVTEAQTRIFTVSVNEIIQTLFARGYSQTQEFEADALALTLLASSGYAPGSLVELLKMLEQGQASKLGALKTSHPLPVQRITTAERLAANYQIPDTRSFRKDRFTRIMR